MREFVPRRAYLVILIFEHLPAALRRIDGVEKNGNRTAHRILDADGEVYAARHKAVHLIFAGAGTDGNVRQKVFHIGIVLGIKHLVRGR